jgi:tRNA pseudouridine13 synthase
VRFLLTHPSDFRGAVATMPAELSTLHLAAFQSAIWNCVLAEWLRGRFGANACNSFVSLKLGSVPILRSIADKDCLELLSQSLPLPCARLHYEDSVPNAPADWQLIVRKVLTDWGIGLADLRLPGLRRPFFSHGERAVWFRPADLRSTQHPDERHSGRRKLILSFELPRGCYATLVVKRITQLHTVTAAG